MKTSTLTGALGVILATVLILTSPVFARDSHYRSGHGDHGYSYRGHVNHAYGLGRHVRDGYSYGGHGGHGYAGRLYYGRGYSHGYGHLSEVFGYWGKDARHHRRGHYRHHHGF